MALSAGQPRKSPTQFREDPLLNGFIDEGLASWTTDQKFAQDFKDPLRSGTFAAVFAHLPEPGEVLVNIPALWAENAFEEAVKAFHTRGGPNADALMHFKFRQGETQAVLDRARMQFLERHGSKIADIINNRSRD